MMPAQSFLPLINERTEENGAIIFHSDAVKGAIILGIVLLTTLMALFMVVT